MCTRSFFHLSFGKGPGDEAIAEHDLKTMKGYSEVFMSYCCTLFQVSWVNETSVNVKNIDVYDFCSVDNWASEASPTLASQRGFSYVCWFVHGTSSKCARALKGRG